MRPHKPAGAQALQQNQAAGDRKIRQEVHPHMRRILPGQTGRQELSAAKAHKRTQDARSKQMRISGPCWSCKMMMSSTLFCGSAAWQLMQPAALAAETAYK
jgi:hypothetical protein